MLPTVSGEFRVATDPELKFTPSGIAMLRITLVANSRKKEGDEWVDDKTCWLRATAWRQMAESAAESIAKGDLVFVQGKMQTDEWEDNGQKRSAMSLNIDEMGPSLRWNAHRKIEQERRSSSGSSSSSSSSSSPSTDPWAAADSEPPFSGGF